MKRLMNFLGSKGSKRGTGFYVAVFFGMLGIMYLYFLFGPETSGGQFTYAEF